MGRSSKRRNQDRKLARLRAERQAIERRQQQTAQRMTAGVALLAFAALLAVGAFVGPDLPGPDAKSASLVVVLGIGLTAGGLSCLAVQGGLLTIAVSGERDQRDALEGNAAPIVWFLGAKLAAYTLMGALLGALGSLVQPSPSLRAVILGLAALFMIATALHFLGAHPVFRHAIIQPPQFLLRRVRRTARAGGAFAPALLGAMTVFLPCGVTQAMQLVAINSGSPVLGAATMFAFVLGTAPLFFSFGYFATKLSDALHARFMKVAGIAIVFVALFTLDGALKLGGSPVTFAKVKESLFSAPPPVDAIVGADGVQEAHISAGAGGYTPGHVRIKSGKPARLLFGGDNVGGCALSLVFDGRQYYLERGKETAIELPAQEPGTIEYTCAMGMYGGQIEVV
ncbi:MAG: sulfite exporter TauE/SafE family protein [Thermoleophilaceae bacterium]